MSNIPLGSYVQDGVRSGPMYSNNVAKTLFADPNGVLTSNNYNTYGPGVLFSPQVTWDIKPAAVIVGGGDVVATTLAVAVTGPGNLTLTGQNGLQGIGATRLKSSPTGNYVQFDWPRVVQVKTVGVQNPNRNITVFGTDWYGFPMQQTYTIGVEGSYPFQNNAALIATSLGSLTLGVTAGAVMPCKAFYTVNRVYIDGALADETTIQVNVLNVYGLPYVINSFGEVSSINYGLNPAVPIANSSSNNQIVPFSTAGAGPGLNGVSGVFNTADATLPATSITGDVRGLFGPKKTDLADGFKNLEFTYYAKGANAWIDQVANTQANLIAQAGQHILPGPPPNLEPGNATAVTGAFVDQQTPATLYGVPQFYTGNPG